MSSIKSHLLPRIFFDDADDFKLTKFVAEQLLSKNCDALRPKGNQLWLLAEEMKLTEHSYQSMRDR